MPPDSDELEVALAVSEDWLEFGLTGQVGSNWPK
jgi:hypothetical protein